MPSTIPPRIVVAGDVSIDWLEATVPAVKPEDTPRERQNWQLQPGTHMVARSGGALLLERMVRQATRQQKVITHEFGDDLEYMSPESVIHSNIHLESFPISPGKPGNKKVYRVADLRGFSGPLKGRISPAPLRRDNPNAEVVVLDDAGNGFRDVQGCWPKALVRQGKRPLVIYKMSRPLARGALWEMVKRQHADRLLVIINANDLREEGANISRRRSWEQTAWDFVTQSVGHPVLLDLTASCQGLVVCFGIDGAVHLSRQGGEAEYTLYYDPVLPEDGFREGYPNSTMLGFNSAVVAAVTAKVFGRGRFDRVGEGVRDGLRAARRLLQHGFGEKLSELDYPVKAVFSRGRQEVDSYIAKHALGRPPDEQDSWCILEQRNGGRYEEVARNIIEHGEAAALKDVPVGRFGSLTFVDRTEIESFRVIENLIREYLKDPRPKRPLSIAVFGPPGSGKSVGVTEVTKNIAGDQVVELPFNVAQFTAPDDLVNAFHKVRNVALRGRTPLVFFDEFDSTCNADRLGWLKYFLAPMQDGEFKDGETMHPIGKAIFVFAGGTSDSYQDFYEKGATGPAKAAEEGEASGQGADKQAAEKKEMQLKKQQDFKDVKGPDFLSRLRGYVNILGPNPARDSDRFYPIRRAMALRWQLRTKAKRFFTGNKLEIDAGVLRAFLRIPKYKHGLRSMEAILDMSQLSEYKTFQQSALPPPAQIEMHVDAEMFWQLVNRDVYPGDIEFDNAKEQLARALHEKHRQEQRDNSPKDDPARGEWDQLPSSDRSSRLRQAEHLRGKLRGFGYDFRRAASRHKARVRFKRDEVEELARMEHDRWLKEMLLDGWRLGPHNVAERTTPNLVEWDKLPKKVRDFKLKTAGEIPDAMAQVGLALYRAV